ncbi:Uncharacterized protein OS=Anabaena variabilis (strain ATCC 29413 / PCC 7937) GN=Ava_2181 PE=4 SV=1: HTH_29: DDE_3 [Gemmata massiliana]|uniref:Tc1-like transposase DDE domain-containing protein n=1 Tax=Gemmata massiliana TaxID=1210884 RepID=A0A6P2CZB7_9BACT|nr:helix-turn-helix domain-containing protein [Gemmata massiliana]VTR94478.1 Uncharacterized protein OS=Anabaena variabilis (strain ATCC 29413 / PCC 7937) GN=Ava_2181 PE=4 SV=1: HTH_29: DDE_3 [Gemmata massiliana]VTR95213.1 Uncharacterized protein OS=Anabaena variabilis (strain ATCC 29413 / PCC 7937) GN=Ava_2181 PE=4 SV=1: HTH_29: DDE_3 [Gemmata massiliana]
MQKPSGPPIEKVRWHAIWLLLRTDPVRTPAQVGDLVGLSVITTRDVLERWNEHGPDGLADGRKNNGSESKLTDDQRTQRLAPRKTRPLEGEKMRVVLVDNAGWHKAKALVVPPNVVLHFRPPCTPELQPAEPLWPFGREAVAKRSRGRIDRLRNVVRDRWNYRTEHPDEVQPRVGFRGAVGLER